MKALNDFLTGEEHKEKADAQRDKGFATSGPWKGENANIHLVIAE